MENLVCEQVFVFVYEENLWRNKLNTLANL